MTEKQRRLIGDVIRDLTFSSRRYHRGGPAVHGPMFHCAALSNGFEHSLYVTGTTSFCSLLPYGIHRRHFACPGSLGEHL